MEQNQVHVASFGRAWFALTVAFALHFDEAATGFLEVYNPTVTTLRARWGWFPMPTYQFREWLVGLIVVVAICFSLTPLAASSARGLRPFAWLYAWIQLLNAAGHTLGTILGRTVASVTFPPPGSRFLFFPVAPHWVGVASVWLMGRLRKTRPI